MNNYSDALTHAVQLPQAASASEHRKDAGRGASHGGSGQWRGTGRSEAADAWFDIFHWAAVSFVIAMTGAVLGYAAGTPSLAKVANVFCYLFAFIASALAVAGVFAPRAGAERGRHDQPESAATPQGE
jgi:hypothetical protein